MKFLRLPAVLEKTGMTRSSLLSAVKRGEFLAPIQITPTGRAVAWPEAEVDKWMADRVADARFEV